MNKPTVLGHEFSGVVEAVGPGCSLRPGDRVVSLHWAQLGGAAFPSPFERKDSMKTFLGLTCDGGYEEFVTTHETAFVKVPNPQKFTAIEAAPVMSTFGTVWQGCVVRGKLQKGERVLVTGAAGGVGGSAVAMLKKLGAHVIGATGDVPGKGDYIRSLGADEVIDSKLGFSKLVSQQNGVDMAVECVGAPTFTDSLRSLKPGGRLVLIGNVTNASVSLPLGLCIVKSLSVIGTDSIESKELEKLFVWLDSNGVKPRIDRVLPLEQAAEAHRQLEQRRVVGRIVLDVNSGIW
jgi:NADPH:quinone reductase-like Zn-dependent oxidoreductase